MYISASEKRKLIDDYHNSRNNVIEDSNYLKRFLSYLILILISILALYIFDKYYHTDSNK
mgnify:CR=1 FL=1